MKRSSSRRILRTTRGCDDREYHYRRGDRRLHYRFSDCAQRPPCGANEANAAVKEANDTISTKNQTIESLQNEIDELTGKVDEAKDAGKETASQIAAYEQLLSAYAAYTNNDITGAGEALSGP